MDTEQQVCSCGKRPQTKYSRENQGGGKMCLKEDKVNTFKREERYTVIKHNQLTDKQVGILKHFIFGEGIPTVKAVVIEADWPIYEDVWKLVEQMSDQD